MTVKADGIAPGMRALVVSLVAKTDQAVRELISVPPLDRPGEGVTVSILSSGAMDMHGNPVDIEWPGASHDVIGRWSGKPLRGVLEVVVGGETRKNLGELRKGVARSLVWLYADLAAQEKKQGWCRQSGDGPEWLDWGMVEYAHMMLDASKGRAELKRRAIDLVRRPQAASFAYGIELEDPSRDGPLIIAFVREEFGPGALRSLYASIAPNMGRAQRDAFGVDCREFGRRFRVWFRRTAGVRAAG